MSQLEDDIRKYLNGTLSAAERHALEKKALNDPFLADALEGAGSISSEEFSSDFLELKATLHNRIAPTSTSRSIWYWPMRVAAGLVITLVAGYLLFLTMQQPDTKQDGPLAANEPATTQPEVLADSASPVSTEAKQAIADAPTVREVPPVTKQSNPKPAEAKQPELLALQKDDVSEENMSSASDKTIEAESLAMADQSVSAREDAQEFKLRLESSANDSVAPASGYADLSRAKKAASTAPVAAAASISGRTIRGTVTDQDDDIPIPGVNVVAKGTSIGTVTDLNGNFELNVPDGTSSLVFSYIGMQTKELPVSTDQVAMQMTPDVSELSEVVVIGYDGEEEAYEGTKWELAEPAGGRKEYKRYLEQNISYPKLALENQVEGKVTIQFTIQPTGQLSDFRVVRSLGYGCDEEVIRLITEGPQWKPTKRNDEPVRGKAKVKLRFTLPKEK